MTHKAKLLTRIAASYDDMFKPLLAVAPEYSTDVKNAISWAKSVLKKENRVVWYLRWARLEMLWDAKDSFERNESDQGAEPEKDELKESRKQKLTALFQKHNRELAAKNGIGESEILRVADGFIGTGTHLQNWLDHVFSLPYPGIQTYDPGYKTRTQVQADMEPLEEAFKRDAKDSLKPKEEDTLWIDFDNGWAWWFLPRAACEDESGAMGHCGNSPQKHRKDRAILSLRQKKQVGKEGRWEPHLTFILHTDPPGSDQGELGEMKGKGNAKPVERYHPYIIRLLEDRRIKGIVGGGYMPKNNFDFGDLTPEQQEEVRKANPEAYFTFDEYVEKSNIDLDEVAEKLSLGGETIYPKGASGEIGFVIRTWYDADDFVRDCGEDNARTVQKCIDGNLGFFVDYLLDDFDAPVELYQGVARQMMEEFDNVSFDLESDRIAREVKDELNSLDDEGESVLRRGLEKAYLAGKEYRDTDRTFRDYMKGEIEYSAENAGEYVGDVYVSKNGTIYQYLPGRRAIEMARDITEDDARSLEWYTPSVMSFNLDEAIEGEGAAIDTLLNAFPAGNLRLSPRALEQEGQDRLFKRPETDEEAKRDGIHVSYLLQPKDAATIKLKSTSPKLTEFMNDLRSQTSTNPLNPREFVWEDSIGIECGPFNGMLHLSSIRSFTPGNGNASRALAMLCGLADKHGVKIDCDAQPFGNAGMNEGQLTSWYKRNGFSEEEGGLVRYPKTATAKEALSVSETGKQYMQLSGDKVVDEATVGDYELFVLKSGQLPGLHLLGMQRVGSDAFDLGQQMGQQVNNVGNGTRAEFKKVLNTWLQKYGQLVIGSHNPEKTRKYEILLKWLGYPVKTRTEMGIPLPYIENAGESKTAFVSPVNAELTVAIDGGSRPKVTISLDLGIPNFTRFAISVPIENLSNEQIDLFCRQAFEALLQNIAAFLISMKYSEDQTAEALAAAESAFMELGGEDASDAGMPDQDRNLRMYEVNFALPEAFIDQTRDRVVMASAVRRTPEVREIQLIPMEQVTPTGTPAAGIEFFLDQSTKNTPRPFSVQVLDFPVERTKPGAWQSRLLRPVA